MVFDNAADLASVERFVPPAGPGRVVITSRISIGRRTGRCRSRSWTRR